MTIDISGWDKGAEEQQRIGRELFEAAKTIGFFYVTGAFMNF